MTKAEPALPYAKRAGRCCYNVYRPSEQQTLLHRRAMDIGTQVQQAIQVLAAEQRGLDEQGRQLQQRRDRLAVDAKGLAAPDDSRLVALREQLEVARALGLVEADHC